MNHVLDYGGLDFQSSYDWSNEQNKKRLDPDIAIFLSIMILLELDYLLDTCY